MEILGDSWKGSIWCFQNHLSFQGRKKVLLQKAKAEGYHCVSCHDIWSVSRSSKFDIKKALSVKTIMNRTLFLCINKHYIVVVLVPNFYLFARSSLFFRAFFLYIYENLFKKHPMLRIKPSYQDNLESTKIEQILFLFLSISSLLVFFYKKLISIESNSED